MSVYHLCSVAEDKTSDDSFLSCLKLAFKGLRVGFLEFIPVSFFKFDVLVFERSPTKRASQLLIYDRCLSKAFLAKYVVTRF